MSRLGRWRCWTVVVASVALSTGVMPAQAAARHHRSRSALKIDSATVGRYGSAVRVTVAWPHNAALLIYFTNRSCARTYSAAKAQIRSEANEGFVFDQLLPATATRGTYTVTNNVVFAGGPYRFSTTCAMLYQTDGRGHRGAILKRASARLVIGAGAPPNG
jgi:hypothetical protein